MTNDAPEKALCEYAHTLTIDDIDSETQQFISHLIFDAIAISIGAYASGHQSGMINEDMALENKNNTSGSTLWSGRGKLPADIAALCNGTWTEILDFQDVVVDPRNNGHLGVTIVPAAIAIAERENSSGAEVIAAVTAGLEVSIAALRAVGRNHRSEGKGFRTTSLAAPLGAAVACAKLLNLTPEKISNAMGIAGACSPNGLMPSLSAANGSFGMDKDWVNGFAAQLAVNAADLAKHGMTASDRVITGEMGIVASHSHGDGMPLMVPKNGAPNIKYISLKKYAACYGVHSAMEAASDLIQKHDPDIAEIKKVVVRVKQDSAKTLATRNITNHMAARFSLPYAVATAIIRCEKSSIHDFEEPAIFDESVISFMKHIEIVADGELTRFHHETGGFPAIVEIHTQSDVFQERIDYPIGSSQRPMSRDDLTFKFQELTSSHFSSAQRKTITQKAMNLADLDSICQLTALLEI